MRLPDISPSSGAFRATFPARLLRYSGKTARDAYMRPLQTCRERQTITGLCGNKNHCTVGAGHCPARGFAATRNLRVNRVYGFPLWGKLSPQVTDEGKFATAGHFPPHPARSAPPSPKGGRLPLWGEFCRKDGKIGVSARWTNNGGCAIICLYKIPPLKEKVLW